MVTEQDIQAEVDKFRALEKEYAECEQRLNNLREQKVIAFGRVQMVDELWKKQQDERSVEASQNGQAVSQAELDEVEDAAQ